MFLIFNKQQQMFRRMGYFDDQSGIMRRYASERKNWDAHLQHTREFVVQAMQGKERHSAAVLGSGWLLDVPLEELSRHFEKVYLYDIRHPAKVRKQAKQLGNVELRVCDISCFALSAYRYAKQYRRRKSRPPITCILPQNALDMNGFDFVFSCNILNQLDILLVDYLEQFFELSREETLLFRSNVQRYHIDLLPRHRSCLVADYEEITYTPDDREISRKTSVHHPITRRHDAQCWIWKFDTKMTYCEGKKTFFKVMGVGL
jgi:hypothetical protein